MTDLRENDVAKLQGKVLRLNDDRTAAYLDVIGKRYWIEVDDLELVERTGPRLEDLPEGAVIKTDDSVPLVIGQGRLIGSVMGSVLRFDEWDQKPFAVIGACPGTPAWAMWASTYTITEKATIDQPHKTEWWAPYDQNGGAA